MTDDDYPDKVSQKIAKEIQALFFEKYKLEELKAVDSNYSCMIKAIKQFK